MMRIHERIADTQCETIIEELDEAWGSQHIFATLMGLDLVCSKTSIPKNLVAQKALLIWTMDLVTGDIKSGHTEAKMSKEPLTQAIHRALLKKRIINLCAKKFNEEASGPSKVWPKVFGSMGAWRQEMEQQQNLQWLGSLPLWLQDVIQFCSKMLRGHVSIDTLLDSALARDHLIPAEEFFRSTEWLKAEFLDLNEMLAAKQKEADDKVKEEEEKKRAAEASAEPPAEPAAAVAAEADDDPMPDKDNGESEQAPVCFASFFELNFFYILIVEIALETLS